MSGQVVATDLADPEGDLLDVDPDLRTAIWMAESAERAFSKRWGLAHGIRVHGSTSPTERRKLGLLWAAQARRQRS